MKSQSSLFTDAEICALKNRMSGIKADPTGIYHQRVKPKLLEIKAWQIGELKKHLNTIIVEDTAEPIQEQSLEEFRQEVGY